MYMLLHAKPIFVTDFNATVSPFIVVGAFGWIKQSFFCILKVEVKERYVNTIEKGLIIRK